MSLRIEIGGVPFDNLTWEECLNRFDELIAKREPVYVVTPNVDHIVKLHKNPQFRSVYDQAALLLADGTPLLWAARFLGAPLKAKISGSDLLPIACEESAKKGHRLFFLGGRPGAAQLAAERLRAKFPGAHIVGTYCPPMGFENNETENEKIIAMLKESYPDILFVGLGSPKQENWILRFYKRYQVPISIGVGGSFEFASGLVKRAPVWMQKVGLEWFWRLIQEPGRLWRRYLVDDIQILPIILKQKFLKVNN